MLSITYPYLIFFSIVSVRAQLVNMGNSQECKTVVNSDLNSYGCTRSLELYTSIFELQRHYTNVCRFRALWYTLCLVIGIVLKLNFLFILDDLKCHKKVTWNFTNHIWSLIAAEQPTRNFFGCLGTGLCNVWWFVCFFFGVLNPLFSFWGVCNFLISNSFSTIVSVSDAPGGGVQVLFGHQKQRSPRIPIPQ
jgi:hypothetical protein